MKSITKYAPFTLLILMLGALISSPVQAHLMVAQHGTLNFVDDGGFSRHAVC